MIRKYRPEDLEDLLGVWEAASAVAHPFLSAEFIEQERHNIPNLYIPNTETWIWEADGRVVGFIALMGNEIGAVFVAPSVQRRGIGHSLVDHAKKQRDELEVEVFKLNAIGRAFYAKYGFVQINESIHEETGCELLRLRLTPKSQGCALG